MKKRILWISSVIVLILSFQRAFAEVPVVQMMEGEIRGGLSFPLGSYHDGKATTSGTLGIEVRHNFKGTPWDCGLMLNLSCARRNFSHIYDWGDDVAQNNRTVGLAVTGDYNFLQGRKLNPFVGAGVGVAFHSIVDTKLYPSEGTTLLFAPRLGVELWSIVRLTGEFNISRKGYNNFAVSLGLVLGGRPKHRK